MPRYFFHLHNDLDVTDEEGADLADDVAARAYAIASVRDIATECIATGHLDLGHYIEIVRDDDTAVQRVRFGDAILVIGRS